MSKLLQTTLILLLNGIATMCYAQFPPVFEGMQMDTTTINVADLEINLVKYSYKPNGVRFLVVHDDEDTGVKAGFAYIEANGGELIDSQHGGLRNFDFYFAGNDYSVDPNAIYTEIGVNDWLERKKLNAGGAEQLLLSAGKRILKKYQPEQLGYIFTLHNNADGGFGIQSYLPGGELENVADSVYVNNEMDEDDLVYVSEPRFFKALKAAKVNVILQSKYIDDDGSLSIYAVQQKIPYVNVEVQHGHVDENLRLINLSVDMLKKFNLIKKE